MLTFIKAVDQMSRVPKPRNILSLNAEEKRRFLDSFDFVFSDIDGVVWNATGNIEGSGDGFNALCEAGKKLIFITNNSARPEDVCLEKLRMNKIKIEANDLIHPSKSIAEYLKSINFDSAIYAITSESFKNSLRAQGFNVMDGPHKVIDESFRDLMADVINCDPVKAVVIDFDFNVNMTTMMKAHYYLRQPDCLLIGGATDYYLPVTKDLWLLGPVGFLKVLEEASRKEVLLFGKPGKALADRILTRYDIEDPSRALMIGDMLDQDVRFGKRCGFQTLIVLSGGLKLEELMCQTNPNVIPNYYANSMKDFVEFMKDVKNSNA
ncbi:glycerol-3-phosphate phosphatase-like [Musca vetustissima]|uniref:glycerol-3-phosphate phosphatase-like n=1 Tax=Musca vetustissima TaxID=27455 RepID=UPI002AB63FB4|nr:glycerol-3-phosphate phosphatase-like [Musca vetustissima]